MTHKFETLAIHAGGQPDPTTGARQTPIYQTASYVFKDTEHAANLFALKELGFIYSRLTNPTVSALQERLAALEGGVGAVATASGHAAQQLAFLNLLQSGDEFIASTKLYGGSINQFKNSFKQFGWKVNFVDTENLEVVKSAINEKTKFIFVESLANPGGVVTDVEALAKVAHDAGIPLLVDNTLATPYLSNPIKHEADIVFNSTTKFLSGNGTTIGGSVVDSGNFDWSQNDKFPLLTQEDPSYHGLKFHDACGNLAFTFRSIAIGLRDLGACQSPFNAFLTLNGIETLPLRIERHVENAQKVAEFLEKHPKIEWVSYAGLPSSKYHNLAKKYLPKGAGSIFTFGVKGGFEAGKTIVEGVELFSHLANIGDTRSLIIHPSSTTHAQLTDEQKKLAGAGDDVIRVSIGIENIDDIIADLEQVLAKI